MDFVEKAWNILELVDDDQRGLSRQNFLAQKRGPHQQPGLQVRVEEIVSERGGKPVFFDEPQLLPAFYAASAARLSHGHRFAKHSGGRESEIRL